MNPTPPDAFHYSPGFYDYIEQGARRSAARILPVVRDALAPASVLDVGCGRGIWLETWIRLGVTDIHGLDGAYVDPASLVVPPISFQSRDIAQPIALGRRWSLAQCLEVGEHLPTAQSATLVQNLVNHADHILFSAAEPGQGGHNHTNEQPLEFWRDLFAGHGYQAYDLVRPAVHADRAIDSWYRYNTVLYVRDSAAAALPDAVSRTRLDPTRPIPQFAPWSWQIRRWLLRPLPVGWVTALGRLKNHLNGSS